MDVAQVLNVLHILIYHFKIYQSWGNSAMRTPVPVVIRRRFSLWKRNSTETDISVEEEPMKLPASKIQNLIRSWLYKTRRLHRLHLAERLMFETNLLSGAQRFFLQLMVFVMLVILLNLASNLDAKQGLFRDLNSSYNFQRIENSPSREEFLSSAIFKMSDTSKKYFVQSAEYFSSGGAGSVVLNTNQQLFSRPAVLAGVSLSMQVPAFTFTAWIKVAPDFAGGYIFRKRIVRTGAGSSLSCWGWYIRVVGGPELHYGAHDFFPGSSNSSGASLQEQVGLHSMMAIPADTDMLLTMIVTGGQVVFYRDLDLLGASPLPRKFTDCANNTEGILIGEAGLTLGQVRFYPEALGFLHIQEIFEGGATLADISTVSSHTHIRHGTPQTLVPFKMCPVTHLSRVTNSTRG
jgi:hypothetical protein